jgi:hypothetical protein
MKNFIKNVGRNLRENYRAYLFGIAMLGLIALLSSCKAVDSPYVKRTTLENKITELGIQKEQAIKVATQDIIQKKNVEISSITLNFQNTADWLYGSRLALDLFEPKGRLWDITSNRLNTAASYAPPPSREALIEQVKTLKEELDESKVSNEELNARYNKAREAAEIAVQTQEAAKIEAESAVRKLAETELEWEKKIGGVQSELIEAQKLIQANSDEKKRQDEWRRKQIRWIMGVTGVLSLAALAGAIFIPVAKRELGTLAAVLGAVTIVLPFITPLYIAIALGAVFIGTIGTIVYKMARSDKSERAVYRGIQEHKATNPKEYKTLLAPILENWTGKYNKDGNVVKDPSIVRHIDNILLETEAK